MKSIEITVSPDGKSQVETKGFAGDECREASRFLESALGSMSSERLTSEFHGQQANTETQSQQEK